MTRRIGMTVAILLLAFGGWNIWAGGYIHAKAALAQHLLARAWVRVQAGDDTARPWPWADTRPVARLRSERLGQDVLVLSGGSGRTLAFGPGLLDNSAAPGDVGMTVMLGHRDTHFRFLRELLPGDELSVSDRAGRDHRYRVRERLVVHKDTAQLAMDIPGLALVTCYPFDAVSPGGPLRYVVLAEPVVADGAALVSAIPPATAVAPARW